MELSAQIKGKVIEQVTSLPIADVRITSTHGTVLYSDDNGNFLLDSLDTYTFERIGYHTLIKEVKLNTLLIIRLKLKPSELNEIFIDPYSIPKVIKKSTTTTSVITQQDIKLGNNVNIAQTINRSPGLFMQNGALNTNRLTIRGIGSRNLFGTSKIRAYFKDIPLTNGSGETTIEDFELNTIAQIKIVKGAASSIYGAGLGGVIQLTPKAASLEETRINSEYTFGSFGLSKSTIELAYGKTKNSFNATYSNTNSDGYRANNTYNRETFTLYTNHFINENNELSFLGSYVDLKAFIPSSLNEEDYLNNPTNAAFTWDQAKGFEDSKRGIFGLSYKHNYKPNLQHITSIFTSFRNAYEPRPFNILDERTLALGVRSRFLGNFKLLNQPLRYSVGGEYFRDQHKSRTFQNLYQDFPEGHGSVQGEQLSNFEEKRNYFNIFFEVNYQITQKSIVEVGLNYNKTEYQLEDLFPVTTDNPDQSGTFEFNGIFSPKLGYTHLFNDHLSVYANISHGFSPLSLNETLLPDGQINVNLKPETGWNYEIGTRGSLLNNNLSFNLAFYRLDIRNLLVSRRTAEDQFIGVNAGQTIHDGIELVVHSELINKKAFSIRTFFNLSINDFNFKEFISDDNDFSGNDLTGVPSEVLNMGIDIKHNVGWYGNINFQYVGQQPITDSNSLYSDPYRLTNLKLGYRRRLLNRLNFDLYVGIDNIFNEVYGSQILINAGSFGGNAPRYFYPGNPVNYYGGLNINYNL